MARRRMISQDLIIDEHFNQLSIEAQNLFIRMIAVSDDCGVVPCSEYTLNCLTNPPEGMKKNILLYVEEIVKLGLGKLVTYNEKPFFIFKRESFDHYQNYIVNKRVKSEYLRISADEFDSIDFSSFESKCGQMPALAIERIKHKVESIKQKEESESKEEKEVYGEFKNVFLFKGEYEKLILKEGKERTDAAIEVLGSYMESKGKRYKSHYAALISWCFKSLDEVRARGKPMVKDDRSAITETVIEANRRYGGKE